MVVLILTCILLFLAFLAFKVPSLKRKAVERRRQRRWTKTMEELSKEERKLP